MCKPSENEPIKKPLKEWLSDYQNTSGKASEILRNIALAGVGIIWIFKNVNVVNDHILPSQNILPTELLIPLQLIIWGLACDLLQYLWRAVSAAILYHTLEYKHDNGKIKKEAIEDVTMNNFVGYFPWTFFFLKIILITIAYIKIYLFLSGKL